MSQPPDSPRNHGQRTTGFRGALSPPFMPERPCGRLPLEDRPQHSSSLDRRVLHALQIIQVSGCNQDLRLANIAAMLGISGSRLQHLVRRDTGESFGRHLNKHRATQAATLLCSTSLLVKEIAAKVGFRNVLSLERRFKPVFGCTPSEYRHRSGNNEGDWGLKRADLRTA